MTHRLEYSPASLARFAEAIREHGWVLYHEVVDPELLEELRRDLAAAAEIRRAIQVKNGVAAGTNGTVHHFLERDNAAFSFLERFYFHEQISAFLNGPYILNSFGGLLNLKDSPSYVNHVHRDIRSFTGEFKLMINMLVMLDDFTLDNGATYFLSGSHRQDRRPDEEDFYRRADRATGKQGSIVLFDSLLWHAAGVNRSQQQRRALTLTFTRPFFKQQLDYPRVIGYDHGERLSAELRQVIGFNSRIPANLDEYYQPVERRMYQPDQG